MESLPLAFPLAGRRVVVLGAGEAAEAKRRLVREAGGEPVTDPAEATLRLAFVAPARGEDLPARVEALKAQGFLVNAVDTPALSDFTVPAILDRAPVTLAIATNGASASLAKALKERLDLLLPQGLGAMARAIRSARATVAEALPGGGDQRAFWAALLQPGAPLDPLAPAADPAAAIAAALADAPRAAATARSIRIPAAGAEALTLGEVRALAAADVVVHPADTPADILALVRRDAARAVGDSLPALPAGRRAVLLAWHGAGGG